MPVLVFTVFLTGQTVNWSPQFAKLAKLNFGIYLIHPIFIDLYEIGCVKFGWHLNPAVLVSTKYTFATVCAFAAAYGLSKFRPLAWSIGVHEEAPRRPALGAVASASI